MKTIKYYRPFGGHVVRVKDNVADAEVKAKRAMYAPKHWLKAAKALAKEETQ